MYKVMIVDDMEIIRMQLKRLKIWGEATGFELSNEARNGQDALTKLKAEPVDLIITDICMPIVDGVELLEEVMKDKLAYCVVLLSEFGEFEYARKGLVLGAFDYLLKPVKDKDFAKLLERAKVYITEKRAEEERQKVYQPSFELELFELLKNGSMADRMADHVFHEFRAGGIDLFRLHSLVKQFLESELKVICSNMPWFMNYADVSAIKSFQCYDCPSIDKLHNSYLTCIQSLQVQIDCLYLGERYGGIINKISLFILENVECGVSLSKIAGTLQMNKNYLCDIFRKKTGMTLLDYITKVKMERAKKLLLEGGNKNYEIADKLGYNDPEYFSRLFKKYCGISPTEYRNLRSAG